MSAPSSSEKPTGAIVIAVAVVAWYASMAIDLVAKVIGHPL